MRNLSRLVALFVLAGIGWGVYWYVGAAATERGLAAWLDARRADGWTAEAATLDTAGFPNRFDTTFTGLDLADPGTGVAWTAPTFQILSLSYKPNHVIFAWPRTQQLVLPTETLDIDTEAMMGSLKLGATPDLPVETSVVETTGARIGSSLGWTAAIDHAQVAMRLSPEATEANTYDVALTLTGFTPQSPALAELRDTVGLPEVIDTLSAELTVTFDKPWDRSAIEDRRPQPRNVRLTRLTAQWGKLALSGAGTVTVDETGTPTGEIALEATNWREIVAVAEATGVLASDYVPMVTAALEMLSGLSGDPDRLDVPLRYARGATLLGPVPVGLAPTFALP